MAIRMKRNKDEKAICGECGTDVAHVLNMFDYMIAGNRITLCDECNLLLFKKSLTGDVLTNSKIKTQADLAIIRRRYAKADKMIPKEKIPINEEPSDDKY